MLKGLCVKLKNTPLMKTMTMMIENKPFFDKRENGWMDTV